MNSERFFPDNMNIKKYIKDNKLEEILKFDDSEENNKNLETFLENNKSCVDPNWEQQPMLPPDFKDLARLHHLVLSRKVLTILEFGLGRSSIVFGEALKINKNKFFKKINNKIRRKNLFECYSVENNKNWIESCKDIIPKDLINQKFINIHQTNITVGTFADRICTFYDSIPNICPDLIYLDGPDQYSPKGDIRGISTKHPDRMPMSGDILAIEHFLNPGTLIVVDGRGANARFLRSNLQRNWEYAYFENFDQHFFELLEPPLGSINKQIIDFTLGTSFYENL